MSDSGYSVYLLRCSDGSLYTGIAADVTRRIKEHECSPRGAKYLKGRGPLKLEFAAVVGSRAEASKLEYRIKRLKRKDKQALISGALSLDALLPCQGDAAGCE